MVVKKIYRYQVAFDHWAQFVEIQKKAAALYRQHLCFEVEYIRAQGNSEKVIEIQTFFNDGDAKKAEDLVSIEPELKKLFQDFLTILDAKNTHIDEETGPVVLKL